MAETARPSRTRRYIYGGLLAAAAVAIGLALIFTVGGAGKKGKSAVSEGTVSSLNEQSKGLLDNIVKDLNNGVVTDAEKPADTTTTVTPVTPATPETPATTGSTVKETTLTKTEADSMLNSLKAKNKFGDPLQAAAALKGSEELLKQYVGENTCWPQDAEELADAVMNSDCPLVILTNGDEDAYALEEDIEVSRYVRVMGNPAVLPTIDGSDATRSFTVVAGGFLELQFVRVRQGGGISRPRYGLEFLGDDATEVAEIRGGAVAVEPGALGANFVGVFFLAVANTPESVADAITSTLEFVGGRIYGGHVFVAAGTVNFFGCNFWDTTLVLPLTDQVSIGGDVLVVGGNVFFTGCIFTATLLFGNFGGLGFNVGVLGGNMVMTFCIIQAQGVAESANGAGQVLFVGGGTMIITGVDFRFASACLLFTGIGDFFVGGGVMVFTGVTIENAYPLLAAYGAGFYLAVGGGVMVETGVTYVQYNAPAHLALTGASIFVGAGTSVHTGVPASFYGTTVLFTGQGGYSFNGAGYSMWLGCPIAVFIATFAFFGLGGLTSQPAGFMVYIGNPAFTPTALCYFVGAGVVMFLGAGGAVIGGSPVYAPAYIFRGYASPGHAGSNYYVNGNQDYANGIGYFNKDGKYGYFWDRPTFAEKKKAKLNITRVRTLEEDGATFDGAVRKLRAERKLSVSSVGSILNQYADIADFASEAAPDSFFIGAGLDRKVDMQLDDNAWTDLAKWAPASMLSAGREIASLKNKLNVDLLGRARTLASEPDSIVTINPGTVLEKLDETTQPMVAVDSDEMSFCGICGASGDLTNKITGASADQCMTGTCDELKEAVPEGTEAAFDWNELSFDPWFIVMGSINPASDKAINAGDIRDGLRSYFVASEMSGVQVTAYPDVVDDLMDDITDGTMPMPTVSKALEGIFTESNPMKVAFLVNDKDQAEKIKAMLNEPDNEDHEDMLLFLQDHLSMTEDPVQINALDSAFEKDINIPAYNTPEFFKAFAEKATEAAGANAVRLVEAGKEGLPLDHVAETIPAGSTYNIKLDNFKGPAQAVTLTLIGANDGQQTAQVLAENLKVDPKGMTVAWPNNVKPGSYYISAVDSATGIPLSMSQQILVTPQGKARKLYGPIMEH